MTTDILQTESADKATLGVTEAGGAVLQQIVDRDDLFNTEAAAFKAAIALALSLDLKVSEVPLPIRTKWSSGGTMSDVIELIGWYREADKPVELANRLADAGLAHLSSEIEFGASIDRLFGVQTIL